MPHASFVCGGDIESLLKIGKNGQVEGVTIVDLRCTSIRDYIPVPPMCGFAVVLSLVSAPVDRSMIERMTTVIRHRGPDDEGSFFSAPVAMGFRRLSILDTSPLGHQPMTTENGQITLVFNGEIYNYVELRRELEGLGHRFKSSGDTEVLLKSYLQWGVDCVTKFNGMWAFVLYDRGNGYLFGSRDRFGIKPLYRHRARRHLLFGSEIKVIRASGIFGSGADWATVADYLLLGRLDESSRTFYDDIEQVKPGTAFVVDLQGNTREWQFWAATDGATAQVNDPAAEFAELFDDAVRLHMRSDVPVGVHLSGGLDSTSIICASARVRRQTSAIGPLMAFAYMTPEFDESRYIADTVAQTGATLVALDTNPLRLWELLSEVLWFQDEPMHTMTPVIGYELMRLTSRSGVKVILNGQGADETIGGYGNYFGDYWCTRLQRREFVETWREIGRYVSVHKGSRSKLLLRQARRIAQSRFARLDTYRAFARWKSRRHLAKHPWFTAELQRSVSDEDRPPTVPELDSTLLQSVYRAPLPLYLRIEDRNSMAHSIEGRLPFLDHRLVSLLFALPPEWRLRGPWNKYVLREAMRDRIPESVRTRADKMGFPVPSRSWFADALSEPVADILNSRTTRERGIYNVTEILRDLARHRAGIIDVADGLFKVAQLELWFELRNVSSTSDPMSQPRSRA
jgi:asparagine synthase (glutamine-hydrolysing)